MTRLEFSEMYPYTVDGSQRSAIFGGKKALLVKILQQGSPIYQDTFYYGHAEKSDHFKEVTVDDIDSIAGWRDCHYYTLYTDRQGNSAWILSGGRYD